MIYKRSSLGIARRSVLALDDRQQYFSWWTREFSLVNAPYRAECGGWRVVGSIFWCSEDLAPKVIAVPLGNSTCTNIEPPRKRAIQNIRSQLTLRRGGYIFKPFLLYSLDGRAQPMWICVQPHRNHVLDSRDIKLTCVLCHNCRWAGKLHLLHHEEYSHNDFRYFLRLN